MLYYGLYKPDYLVCAAFEQVPFDSAQGTFRALSGVEARFNQVTPH